MARAITAELDRRPARILLLVGLLGGLALAAATPPFQAPDEPAHFCRAWMVSKGRLTTSHPDGLSESLPAGILRLIARFNGLPFHPERKTRLRAIVASFSLPLDERRQTPYTIPNTLQYTFVPYLPQAAAIAAGRAFHLSPLAQLYLARLANLIAATGLIYLGVARAPAYRWLLTALALTPMAIFMRASASADGAALGFGFLLAGQAAGLAWGPPARGGRRSLLLLAAAAAGLCLCKPVYLPIALVALLVPAVRFPRGRRALWLFGYAVVVALAFAYAMTVARSVKTSLRPGVVEDPDQQVAGALQSPAATAAVVARDYLLHTPRYLSQLVGRLGWLDTELPLALRLAYLGLLAALCLLDCSPEVRIGPGQRALLALLSLSTLALIALSQYAAFTPLGASYIEGLQGRYFLPLAPAAVWIAHSSRLGEPAGAGRWRRVIGGFFVLSLAVTLYALLRRYYG